MNKGILIFFVLITLSFCSFGQLKKADKNDRLILNVSDYGAIGDGKTDDGPALRKLFKMVSSINVPAKIIFEKNKIYYLGKEENHLAGTMFLDRADDLIIEGNNALLLINPNRRAFELYRSKDITLRNFQIDYSPLPFTQGRITKINNSKGYLEFKVDDGYPQPYVRNEEYYVDGRVSDCATLNGESLKFYQGHSRISSIKNIEGCRYAVNYRMHRQYEAKVGDYFAMKVWLPEMDRVYSSSQKSSEFGENYISNYANIQVNHSNNITVENIISYASPKMTLNARSCTNLVVRRLIITRKPGRTIASCSDGIHIKGNEIQPLIENCYIEGTLDDGIHIKISGDEIEKIVSSQKIKIRHMDTRDNTNLGIGKRVMVYDPINKKELATAKILTFEYIDHKSGWVTLNQVVPDIKVGHILYLQSDTEAVIQNCQFGTQLQRAILTHQPTTIKNCAILDNGQGINMALSTSGIEGPPTQRLIVDNAAFVNLTKAGIFIECPSKEYNQLGSPQLIIKNSIFNLPNGVSALNIKNSNGVFLSRNKFSYVEIKPDNSIFQFSNTEITNNSHNIFQKGWFLWDSDYDGLADVLEIPGDADGDNIENKLDKDSNNNGINDFDEFKMAKNPFKLN
ncbi:MAG: hypothetical protein P8K68_06920 [Algibacter sp.]|uniref:hypothetical protein n=1 Tax=Algibacter sp. TaxID=1872428 RepID=UPI00263554A0|nr:hypothetical protein [Algibacter sp.]MDG1729916.1 hypothetical protein [Algibacter sp.]MDG2178507.1 hypothetical protein [Algibacter sp.]